MTAERQGLFSVTSARQRVLAVAAIGSLTGAVAAWFAPWQLTVLSGWDMAAALLVAWVWLSVGELHRGADAGVRDSRRRQTYRVDRDDQRNTSLTFSPVFLIFAFV
jgi:sterol desaturase/sphingolipid hydroxylase (fatty acid hydroxylase superfamily)